MARGKKTEEIWTPEEKLAQALVPAEEQPYPVPENWCWVRLSTLAKVISKGTTPSGGKSIYTDTGVSFLRVENLNEDGTISHENIAHIPKDVHLNLLKRSILEEGDILISIAGTLGKTGIVQRIDLPLNTNQALAFVRLIDVGLHEKYIKYSVDSPIIHNLLLEKTKVTSIPNLTLEIIGNCSIPLAPIYEQQRIVDRIERLFAKLDEAKEKAQAVVDSFETHKAAILHKAFTGELTAKWRQTHKLRLEDWKEITIDSIASLITKGASPKWQGINYTSDTSQTLFVTSENVREGFLSFEKEKYLDNKINEIQSRSILHYGDVLVNIVGASIGRAAIFNRNQLANINQAVCIIRPKEGINNQFICLYLNSPFAQIYYSDNKVETARANISLSDIKAMRINLPSLDEQLVILQILQELIAKEQRAKDAAEAALGQIDTMKKAILARAFRGELGTNDPAEEWAGELVKKVL